MMLTQAIKNSYEGARSKLAHAGFKSLNKIISRSYFRADSRQRDIHMPTHMEAGRSGLDNKQTTDGGAEIVVVWWNDTVPWLR